METSWNKTSQVLYTTNVMFVSQWLYFRTSCFVITHQHIYSAWTSRPSRVVNFLLAQYQLGWPATYYNAHWRKQAMGWRKTHTCKPMTRRNLIRPCRPGPWRLSRMICNHSQAQVDRPFFPWTLTIQLGCGFKPSTATGREDAATAVFLPQVHWTTKLWAGNHWKHRTRNRWKHKWSPRKTSYGSHPRSSLIWIVLSRCAHCQYWTSINQYFVALLDAAKVISWLQDDSSIEIKCWTGRMPWYLLWETLILLNQGDDKVWSLLTVLRGCCPSQPSQACVAAEVLCVTRATMAMKLLHFDA